MTRSLGFFLLFAAAALSPLFATDLPTKDGDPDSMEIEPPLLIPNRDTDPRFADPKTKPDAPETVDLDKLEKDLARAKRSAAGAGRLCQMGIIAQVEVEQRQLRVARVQAQLENARLTEAKDRFARDQERLIRGEIGKADLAESETDLAHAIQSAHAADVAKEHAELEFAENNVRRQQKLVALGSGRKSDVSRAERKVSELKAAKENN